MRFTGVLKKHQYENIQIISDKQHRTDINSYFILSLNPQYKQTLCGHTEPLRGLSYLRPQLKHNFQGPMFTSPFDPNCWDIRIYCFLSPRFTGGLGPPYFINYILSPYDSYVTQLHFFSEFETSPLLLLKKARHLTLIVETSEFTAFWAPVLQRAWVPLKRKKLKREFCRKTSKEALIPKGMKWKPSFHDDYYQTPPHERMSSALPPPPPPNAL